MHYRGSIYAFVARFAIRLVLTAVCFSILPASADVVIPYNEYSSSPTIGRGDGTSWDPRHPGYGAMRIFIQKVMDYTGALPSRQKVIFRSDTKTGREINALRAGVQFANKNAQPKAAVSEPSWGSVYNSVPFGMNFQQTLGFLYDARLDEAGRNGIALAQSLLDRAGGTQIVFPVVGSTMQGSGYFPRPVGRPQCHAGDADCKKQGNGIGLAGLCTSGWRIRYLAPPEDVVSRACDLLVERGVIKAKTLQFYPAVGGQSVLLPMQTRTIQGFEFVTPVDDLVDFFPVINPTMDRPLGNPNAGNLDCGPAIEFPIPAGTKSNCTQNIGQLGGRYAHHPAWHQPFLLSWMHVDKAVWDGLTDTQRTAILRAARESVVESYNATESIACRRLKDMLDVNVGINQRNPDGTVRLVDGKPVSARITLATWPEDALKVLREARDAHMASLEGPKNPSERTDAQRDFSTIFSAWSRYAARIGANRFQPGQFPAKTGLTAREACDLAG
jgi:hypothetical protein